MEMIAEYLNPLNWGGFWDAVVGGALLIYCGVMVLMPLFLLSIYKRVGLIMDEMKKSELPE